MDYDIKKLRLQEGDIAVLKLDKPVPNSVIAKLKVEFEKLFTGCGYDNKVLILTEGLELVVLTKEEIESRI